MDGVILDSGEIWQRLITELFTECRIPLSDLDEEAFAGGDNSQQWAAYLHHVVGIPFKEKEIVSRVVDGLLAAYEEGIPLLPGAVAAITRLAAAYPLALASSSPRPAIAFILERSGLGRFFSTWVSSDDVPRGKPQPDVYLKACERLGIRPQRCVAVEDSRFGIRAAKAAGLKVIAIPQPHRPLDAETLILTDHTLESIERLGPQTVRDVLGENAG